jgi:histidine triad (HIT) family protein
MPDCIFCKVAAGEIESKRVYEDAEIVAFHDINKKAPVHILIIPRKHIASLLEVSPEDGALLGKMHAVAVKLAQEHGIAESGFRLVLNCNQDAGQSVDHIHMHLMGGRPLGWPPG